jgi:hypothetical protein
VERIRLQTLRADAGYVEEKLGREFYSQLGGMRGAAEFRLDAVERAGALYDDAVAKGADEPKITAHGLLVLQRTLLICEDLGALIFALAGTPHWSRLTSYKATDLDEAFSALLDHRLDLRELWQMPPDDVAEDEGLSEAQAKAMRRLREVTALETEAEIDVVAGFWVFHRRSVKNVMHGFSFVPACLLLEPPGAGVLSEQVDPGQPRPFAASLVSELDDRQRIVATTTYTVDLTPTGIDAVRKIASTAANVLTRLAEARRFAAETRHRYVLGDDFIDRLDEEDRDAIAGAIRSRADE